MKWHDKNLPFNNEEYDMNRFGKSEPGKIYHITDKYIELPIRYDELISTIKAWKLQSLIPNLDNDIEFATSLLNKQYITHEENKKFGSIERKVYNKMTSIRDNSQPYRLLHMDAKDKQEREDNKYLRKKMVIKHKIKRKPVKKCICKNK